MKVVPVCRWMAKESMEIGKADALSKEFSYVLAPQCQARLEIEFQCMVLCPKFGSIPNELAAIILNNIVAGIVVPCWEAKTWWPQLVQAAKELGKLKKEDIVFSGCRNNPNCKFFLALFH